MIINPFTFTGGGGPFDPLSLSPTLWLDASVASSLYDATSGGSLTAANGTVRRWEDQSGNGNHLTESNGPQRKTSIQNSLDGLLFSNNLLARSGFDVSSGTIWILLKEDGTTGSYGTFVSRTTSGNEVIACYDTMGNRIVYVDATSFYVNGNGPHSSGAGGDSNASRTGDLRLYELTAIGSLSPGTFGIGQRANGGYPFGGHIFEMIVIAGSPSAGNRADVLAYLDSKWGSLVYTP